MIALGILEILFLCDRCDAIEWETRQLFRLNQTMHCVDLTTLPVYPWQQHIPRSSNRPSIQCRLFHHCAFVGFGGDLQMYLHWIGGATALQQRHL